MQLEQRQVVLYCSNLASTCSHALLLSQTRWIVMTGWRTSISRQPVFKHIWIVVLYCIQASVSTLCFKHIYIVDQCLHTRISIQLCVLTHLDYVLCLCANISRQPFDQTRLDCGSCCLQASSPRCVSNTFEVWILVCVHASVSCTVFHTLLG